MPLTLVDKAMTAYYLLAPPAAGPTTLPGPASAKFGTVFGWVIGGIGILAVISLMVAGGMFMMAKHNQQNSDGPGLVLKILAGIILVDSAVAIVTAIQ